MRKRPLVPLAVCFLLLLTLLDWYSNFFLRSELSPALKSHLGVKGAKEIFEGRVLEPLELRPTGAKGVVELLSSGLGEPLEGKILLSFANVPDWERGDRVQFETHLKRPRRYKNQGSFDYRRYLERQGIVATGFVGEGDMALLLEKGRRPFLWPLLPIDRLRTKVITTLQNLLPPREAGFLTALLVGDRSGVSSEVSDSFQKTGTIHLLAISGQHIGMVGLFFFGLFLWLLKRSEYLMLRFSVKALAGFLALIPIWFYIFLAGSPPSALRAGVIAFFVPLALFMKREGDPLSTLAAAAMGIALIKPSAYFSASYQLSFLAVLGLILFRKKQKFWNFLWMSIGATLMTAPLVVYDFHQWPLSGILMNIWTIPCVSFLLIFAGGSLLLTTFIPFVGQFALSGVGWHSKVFLNALHFASQLSWTISFYPTAWEACLCFGGVLLVALMWRRPQWWRQGMIGIILLGLVWMGTLFLERPRNLEITFIDVGQGDSALIRTPGGKNLLIDGGGFLIPGLKKVHFDVGSEVLVPYLKRRGVRQIDRILLSHPHPDHFGGLAAVIQNFPIGEFWSNGQRFPDESFDRLITNLEDKKVPQKILKQGDTFFWEGLRFSVAYPDEIRASRNINDNSLVVKISSGDFSVLFPGDIEKEGERALSDRSGVEATLLKIPHHASRTSSSVPFIETVHPQFAVASLGEENQFKFPHPGVLEKYERRDIQVFRTDRNGEITFSVPPDFPKRGLSIRTFFSGE